MPKKKRSKSGKFKVWNIPTYILGFFSAFIVFGGILKFLGVLLIEDIFVAWVGSLGLPWFYTFGLVVMSATTAYFIYKHKFRKRELKMLRQGFGMWSGFMLLYILSAVMIYERLFTIQLIFSVAIVAMVASVVIPMWAKTVGGK